MDAMKLLSMFGLLDKKEYIEEIDTGDDPVQAKDSQPTQFDNAHSWRVGREDRNVQHLSAEVDHIANRQYLCSADQTDQWLAVET